MKKIEILLWRKNNTRGQVLLIVVLTMVVALTVGLSIASRTISNLKFSKQNEESQRAFSAAEAGIEQALKQVENQSLQSTLQENNSSYTTTATVQSGTSFLLNGGGIVDQDVGTDVFLASYPTYSPPLAQTTVTLYWNTENQNSCLKSATTQAALEVVVLSGTTSSPTLSKYIYDPCSRISNTSANGGQGTIGDITFVHSAVISVTNGLLMKVIPIYNSTKIGVSSTVALPSQGSVISSVGTSGETVRKVVYFSSFPQLPLELFPYSLISQ